MNVFKTFFQRYDIQRLCVYKTVLGSEVKGGMCSYTACEWLESEKKIGSITPLHIPMIPWGGVHVHPLRHGSDKKVKNNTTRGKSELIHCLFKKQFYFYVCTL